MKATRVIRIKRCVWCGWAIRCVNVVMCVLAMFVGGSVCSVWYGGWYLVYVSDGCEGEVQLGKGLAG